MINITPYIVNILLENSNIQIALNFTIPPKVTKAEENKAENKVSTTKSSSNISDTGRYIDEKYKLPTMSIRVSQNLLIVQVRIIIEVQIIVVLTITMIMKRKHERKQN